MLSKLIEEVPPIPEPALIQNIQLSVGIVVGLVTIAFMHGVIAAVGVFLFLGFLWWIAELVGLYDFADQDESL